MDKSNFTMSLVCDGEKVMSQLSSDSLKRRNTSRSLFGFCSSTRHSCFRQSPILYVSKHTPGIDRVLVALQHIDTQILSFLPPNVVSHAGGKSAGASEGLVASSHSSSLKASTRHQRMEADGSEDNCLWIFLSLSCMRVCEG